MFIDQGQSTALEASVIRKACAQAVRAIPPAFPLDATVAVNPFLGQTGQDFTSASAHLSRCAGVSLVQPRHHFQEAITDGRIADADLLAALEASGAAEKPESLAALKDMAMDELPLPEPVPTVAEIAADLSGIDWPSIIEKTVGLWAAGHFDRGQALWSPAPDQPAFAAWRSWASRDLTPEIAGLSGFCSHVSEAPDSAERAIRRASERLNITAHAAETVFHRLLIDLGGWAQHARWLLWRAEQDGNSDGTLEDLLAIRLVWEEALMRRYPGVADQWQTVLSLHAVRLAPARKHVVDEILQDASERAYLRALSQRLFVSKPEVQSRPVLQAAFCIDVRSEVFRRALENQDPGIETLGFAGFFGLPVSHREHGSDIEESHLPVLLKPTLGSTGHGTAKSEKTARIKARSIRALGRFRQAAVSSFAYVEAAGLLYAGKLMKDTLGLGGTRCHSAPRLDPALGADAKAATAAAVLKAMSLTSGHAKTILLVGHGAHVTNNPHQSAYHCGACGGYSGEVSARLLASLLNDAETRAGLPGHGIHLPDDTLFVAALHDTTTDEVTVFDGDFQCDKDQMEHLRTWLTRAGAEARAERAIRLTGASAQSISKRATNWSEIRPEWGLAGCATFIAAPRKMTAGASLNGRAFLHSYDWRADDGFKTLELILTAPVVVASWISLQYYGSTVAPDIFGGGNKLIHNVVGGIGVVEGNGGRLRPGLPWQVINDGENLAHTPLRLSVLIEAPEEPITHILNAHPEVRELFENRWLHLFALKDGRIAKRYCADGVWKDERYSDLAA
ncbi:DUF2309 domain-containing protein [Martelella lutilitoris]|uniref:Probable inorganic carbon transporter subunit DabA n=1 Tax=Martelella lutilitoris TaxID=2583532 RepID=A0A5C4JP44_9HYPH|nr:DUF2309 domain-containing protein [Martelella lutilitoris]TNB46359.1 DUF2309 domain-containing protein [Martelella lutilitoris]